MQGIKAPFPYFGSKRSVADIVWKAFGEVANYVEPFAGSLAVLLAAPKIPKIETVSDIDCFLANFWRAISLNPSEVVKYADYPISQIDLHSRHKWLIKQIDLKEKLLDDPEFYDAKIAGYWIWGYSASIGNNWLQKKGESAMPLLSSAGGGIHGLKVNLLKDFESLHQRLKRTRVCCVDWSKLLTPSITYNNVGISLKDFTAVFLDPPYNTVNREKVYSNDNDIFKEVSNWAISNGENPRMRVCLCGYDGDYDMPNTWQKYEWRTGGGYANKGIGDTQGKTNSKKEIMWFNAACNKI
jgi:site-specific DNA-adenine methylase